MKNRPASWPTRIVDSHVHAWPSGLRHPAQRTAGSLDATLERLVDVLGQAGVDGAILVQPSILSDPSTKPDIGRKRPRLLSVVQATLDGDGDARLEASVARGAVGVRIHLLAHGLPEPDQRESLWRVVRAAARLAVVAEWIVRPRDAWIIRAAADRYPELVQMLDHVGLPDDLDATADRRAVLEVAAVSRAYTKLSAMHSFSVEPFPYRDTWPWVEAIVAGFGPARVMWGSNWPLGTEQVAYEDLIELMWQLPFLAERDFPAILGGTAERVWPALAASRVGITEGSGRSDG